MNLSEIKEKCAGYPRKERILDKKAAVLVPLVEREGELCLLFEVRAKNLRNQPNEVCFPGGRIEQGESAEQCALRETREELGLSDVEVFTALDAVKRSSGQTIEAVVGSVRSLEELNPAEHEVAEVFTVPLEWFRTNPPKYAVYSLIPDMEHAPEELKRFLPNYHRSWTTPIWTVQGQTIWGMTARLLVQLLQRLE